MSKISVIIDADTGLDDSLALFYAASNPKLDILAVTATYGNTTIENALKNTMNALAICGRTDIPVARGASKGWKKKLDTSPHVHGESGIGNVRYESDSSEAFINEMAWDFSYEILRKSKGPVTYIALGPLTNLATLLRKYPDIRSKIDRVLFMGGTLRKGFATQTASVNIYHDPEAARYVLKSGVEFHMCSHHMTQYISITKETAKAKIGRYRHPVCQISVNMINDYCDNCNALGENIYCAVVLHDPAVILYLTEPEYFTATKYYCDIETSGEYTYGFSVIDVFNIYKKSEQEFNIHFVMTDERKGEYLLNRFIEVLASYSRNDF
jgi:inosine-uridine nucleoside N-ribohydrolase